MVSALVDLLCKWEQLWVGVWELLWGELKELISEQD